MQNVEVAYELRHVTDYIIAAPSESTGVGAPYDVIVKDLFIADDQRMYTSICHDYYEQKTDEYGHIDDATPSFSRPVSAAGSTRRTS